MQFRALFVHVALPGQEPDADELKADFQVKFSFKWQMILNITLEGVPWP